MKKTKLFDSALHSMNNAYAPYSKFSVGAAILADNGQIYSGCNVENVSFPSGTCAEAGAIAAMINGGGHQIAEILIISKGNNLITPCGNCLQKIREFADENTKIHLADMAGVQKTFSLNDLLPMSFKEF